jgi:putative transcriptional regulator
MFDKCFLQNKIINVLENNEFAVLATSGCFDIAAKRENLLLIKTLMNVDALNKDQAMSLQTTSYFLSAYPFVVSMKNNRELLDDKIVYSRFDLPVITPKLFEEILREDISIVHSAKGRHTTEINSFALREKRKELGYTLDQLAGIIGMSKKALYEIENKRVNPTDVTVRKLEVRLNINLGVPMEMKTGKAVYLRPRNESQGRVSKELIRIGVDNSVVYSAPFDIVGRENFSVITKSFQDTSKINKDVQAIKSLSKIFSSFAVFIAGKSKEKSIDGIPVILERELPDIESPKEFEDLLLEKE